MSYGKKLVYPLILSHKKSLSNIGNYLFSSNYSKICGTKRG